VYPNLIQNPEAPEEQTPVKGAITTIAMQTQNTNKTWTVATSWATTPHMLYID